MADQEDEHGPWEKYGGGAAVAAPEAEHGPWEKYSAPPAAPKIVNPEAAAVAARPSKTDTTVPKVLARPAMPGTASRYAGPQSVALPPAERASRNLPGAVMEEPFKNVGTGAQEVAGRAPGQKEGDYWAHGLPSGIHHLAVGAGEMAAIPALGALTPAMLPEAGVGLAGGTGAQYIAKKGTKALGANEDWSDVAGDAAAVGVGSTAAKEIGRFGISDSAPSEYAGAQGSKIKDSIGRALREKPTADNSPTTGTLGKPKTAASLKPGVKAIANLAKLAGGPEVANALVPAHPEPVGPFKRFAGGPIPDQGEVSVGTIAKNQESALGENKKFDLRSQKAQQQTAAQRDAAYEKEGQEQMAIQERYDQAQKARVAAEKDVKNSQLKQEQAHEKAMKEIETSRQKELAAQEKLRNLDAEARQKRGGEQGKLDDAHAKNLAAAEKEANDARAATERLRTQHGSDLMKRQTEHDALVKAASKASEDENVAKAEVVKGSSTPGAAKPKNGVLRVPIKGGSFPNNPAGNIQNVPRDLLPGIIQRTGDPAAVNEFSRTTNTPALYVPESYAAPREYPAVEPKNGNGLTFSTDKVGVRWAENPDGVRVSIPKNVPSEEVPVYASEKMGEQIKLRAQHGIASNGEDGIVGVNEEPASKTRINGSGGGNGSLEEQRRSASEMEKGVKYFVEHLKAPGKSRVEISSGTANSDFRPGPGKRIIRVDKNGESIFR